MFLNSAGDLELLPRVLDAAERFGSRPDEAEMARLLSEQRLSIPAGRGLYSTLLRDPRLRA